MDEHRTVILHSGADMALIVSSSMCSLYNGEGSYYMLRLVKSF